LYFWPCWKKQGFVLGVVEEITEATLDALVIRIFSDVVSEFEI